MEHHESGLQLALRNLTTTWWLMEQHTRQHHEGLHPRLCLTSSRAIASSKVNFEEFLNGPLKNLGTFFMNEALCSKMRHGFKRSNSSNAARISIPLGCVKTISSSSTSLPPHFGLFPAIVDGFCVRRVLIEQWIARMSDSLSSMAMFTTGTTTLGTPCGLLHGQAPPTRSAQNRPQNLRCWRPTSNGELSWKCKERCSAN